VVEPHIPRRAPLGSEAFEASDDAVGVDGAVHVDGQALPAVLVDHVEQLQLAAVRNLVELEAQGPQHVRPGRAHRPHRHADAPERLLALAVPDPQALLPPQAVDALAIDVPAGLAGLRSRSTPSPPGTVLGELA